MFENIITQFSTLVGVAALIAALVNIFKVFGLPDGYAARVSAGLSLLAFSALVYLRLFAPSVDVAALDAQAGQFAELSLYLLGFVVQMGLPAKFHDFLKSSRVPVIGASHEYFGVG